MAKPSSALAEPPILVVMGVSGCGKSTLGQALAIHLGCEFAEGDQFHPPENVAKMAAGTPLTDEDRWGWLRTLSERMAHAHTQKHALVLSCSALRKPYRDILREGASKAWFVHLHGDMAVLRQRMVSRPGHYMPPSLLQSQLDTLEMPQPDERVVSIDIATPLPEMVSSVLASIR
jgi:gluconokinase